MLPSQNVQQISKVSEVLLSRGQTQSKWSGSIFFGLQVCPMEFIDWYRGPNLFGTRTSFTGDNFFPAWGWGNGWGQFKQSCEWGVTGEASLTGLPLPPAIAPAP